jgi:hypothetical protein
MIDDHGFFWEFFISRSEIAQERCRFRGQVFRADFCADPQTETDAGPEHRVAEDRSRCNTIGIVVSIDFHVLLPAYLVGDGFCGFFKRDGHGDD